MKTVALFIDPLVIHSRLLNLDRPVAGLDLPGRMMAVAHHQAMAVLVEMIAAALNILLDFPLDGRLQCPAGAVAQNVVDGWHACQMKLKCVTVHEAYLSVPRGTMVNR